MNEEKYMIHCLNEYEKKLKELMVEEEYIKFAIKVAKEGYRKDVLSMPEGEFKEFCIYNFELITK